MLETLYLLHIWRDFCGLMSLTIMPPFLIAYMYVNTANSKINLADLKTACAALPDKDPLVTLIYSKECSATSINMAALAKLPTLALLEMLPAMTLDEANLVARDKEELRKILIHRISELPDFKVHTH